MLPIRYLVLGLLLEIGQGGAAHAAQPLPPPPFGLSEVHTGPEADRRVAWWREARFGMFIHFGVYSVAGHGEWARFSEQIPQREYAKLADHFTPDPKAPDEWAKVARQGGMKYMVLTARHHDGFALFDSRANEFNSVRTAAHQDIVREFVDAARAQGMRIGLYYSPLDWRFPGYFFPDLYAESAEAMRDQYHQEMAQLASDYGKLDLIWFDGGGEPWLGFGGIEFDGGKWKSRDRGKPYSGAFSWQDDLAIGRLRQLQPQILINDRTSAPGDWRTREGADRLGAFDNIQPWELCVTLAGTWGYQPGAQPRSFQELVLLLTNTAARDGNLLLNVGPAPTGHIPEDQVARLQELGRWLQSHGKAIYGTRGGPFLPSAELGSTRVGKTIFLHVLPGPDGTPPLRSIVVPEFPAGPKLLRARVLGAPADLRMQRVQPGEVRVALPGPTLASPTTIVELTYDGSVMDLAPRALSPAPPHECVTLGLKACPMPFDEVVPSPRDMLAWTQDERVLGFRNTWRQYPGDVFHADPTHIHPLPRSVVPLSPRYQFNGQEFGIEDYLREQAVTGLLVIYQGHILYEHYAHGNSEKTLWTSRSVAKSVVSILIGMAIREGRIKSVDDPITTYLPELRQTAWAEVTLRNLLQHTSGVAWNENYADPKSDFAQLTRCEAGVDSYTCILNLVRGVGRKPGVKPGEAWSYNTGGAWLVGRVLERATGMPIARYLETHLWRRFGMESDGVWQALVPGSIDMGGHGFNATLRDWGRFGLFVARGGMLPDGTRLLPPDWLAQSRRWTKAAGSIDAANPEGQYGYQWWHQGAPPGSGPQVAITAERTMWAEGIYGQVIAVDSVDDLVMVQWSTYPVADPSDSLEPQQVLLFSALRESLAQVRVH